MTRRTAVAGGLVTLLVVVGTWFGWQWWSHPRVLDGYGNGVEIDPSPMSQAPYYSPLTLPRGPRETITIKSARPRITDNTAVASVRIAVCTPRHDRRVPGSTEDYESIPFGARGGVDTSSYCSSVRTLAASSGHTKVEMGEDYFFAAVTPRRPGLTAIAGVDIRYSRDLRHFLQTGTQRTGLHFTTRAK